MRLIDVDALKKELRMADRCEDCERNARDCQYVYGFTRMDICSMLDDAPTVEMPGWISVQDRLPEKNVPVLVYEKHGYVYVDRLEAECAWQIAITPSIVITHWMPLPEPPEEVSGDV